MTSAKEYKARLILVLSQVVDPALKKEGFSRNAASLVYKRRSPDSVQEIDFAVSIRPKYEPSAQIRFCPMMRLRMKRVTRAAQLLAKGSNYWILAEAPKFILNQPIEFAAPRHERQHWFVSNDAQIVEACKSIRNFIVKWAIPLLSEMSAPADLARLYEAKDQRILNHEAWWLCIVAVYFALGRLDDARKAVMKHFGRPGLRKHYSAVFENLGI